MNAATHVRLSWVLLIGSLIAWPITALTVFADEPQGILGLSFLALIISAYTTIVAAAVHAKQEEAS